MNLNFRDETTSETKWNLQEIKFDDKECESPQEEEVDIGPSAIAGTKEKWSGWRSRHCRRRILHLCFGLGLIAASVVIIVVVAVSKSPSIMDRTDGTDSDDDDSSSVFQGSKQIGSFKCFESRSKLFQTIDQYLEKESAADTILSSYGPIRDWCVGGISNFSHLFDVSRQPAALTFNEPLTNWDVSNAQDMAAMFHSAADFDQDLSTWNVSKVKNMEKMFYGASSFDCAGKSLKAWDTSKVETMKLMFYAAQSFVGQGLSNWAVGNVRDMEGTFMRASSFDADLNWRTSKVHTMYGMFEHATRFNKTLNFDTGSVQDMRWMFNGAVNFQGRGIDAWNTTHVVHFLGMFYETSSLNVDLSSWNTHKATSMAYMFAKSAFNGDISGWKLNHLAEGQSMFQNASRFSQNLCSWGSSLLGKPVDLVDMFEGAIHCPSQETPIFNGTDMPGPFCFECSNQSEYTGK